jgi:hypothetical protein
LRSTFRCLLRVNYGKKGTHRLLQVFTPTAGIVI